MRKKVIKIGVGVILGLIVVLLLIYRLVNVAPSAELSANEQALAILRSGDCAACHVQNPDLPFYASLPVIGDVVKKDAYEGVRKIDLAPVITALEKGQPVDIVSLNKLEQSFTNGTMPLAKYYLVHWGTQINSTEREMMLNWVKEERVAHHSNGLAAEEFANEPLQPLPSVIDTDPAKVALGRMLYNDTRLSKDNTISCASCHALTKGGCDNKSFSEGVNGQLGGVNAPTVFNAYFNFVQFWDGRAADLAEQAAGPPLNPVEMACESFDEIIAKLQADKRFAAQFTKVYPDGITEQNICNAIQEYEKTLLTPNAPFDRYLTGDKEALTADQIAGYELFKKHECATCHAGTILGGQSYEYMGLKEDYFAARGTELTEEDYGRGKQEESAYYDHRFKTPGLRNVALTAPYFHDATQATLADAVTAMMTYQVGLTLTEEETRQMVAFLESLTGEMPAE